MCVIVAGVIIPGTVRLLRAWSRFIGVMQAVRIKLDKPVSAGPETRRTCHLSLYFYFSADVDNLCQFEFPKRNWQFKFLDAKPLLS